MFEVDGYVGEPLGFGIFTDSSVEQTSPITHVSLIEERWDNDVLGIKDPYAYNQDVEATFTPVFNIVAEFTNKKTGKTVVACNGDGVSWGRRLADDTLVIKFAISDVAATLGVGDWDVHIIVDELIMREHVLEEHGVIHIKEGEPDPTSLSISKSWLANSSLEDYDLSVPKTIRAQQMQERVQTCMDCKFQTAGECRAIDPQDSVTWMPVLSIVKDGLCPKGYWS